MATLFLTERSAGGLVFTRPAGGKIRCLMVQVKNLIGEIVWTFPNGHLEGRETDARAALREVLEETGWKCRIVNFRGKRVFEKVRYRFKRGIRPVRKEVVWFLMAPVSKTGKMDPREIRKVAWRTLDQGAVKISYPSDKKLLKKLNGALRAQARRE